MDVKINILFLKDTIGILMYHHNLFSELCPLKLLFRLDPMPPPVVVFSKQGSQDASDVKTTGFEVFKALSYFENKFLLSLAVISSMASGVMPVMMNLFMGDLTTTLTTSDDIADVTPVILRLSYINIAMVVIMTLSMSIRSYATPKLAADIRFVVYKSLMEQPISWYDEQSTGVLISRLSEDVTLVRETFVDKALTIVQNIVQAIGGIVLAFVTSWLVSLVCLVAIPFVLITFFVGEKIVDKLWIKFNEKSTTAASKAEEVITQFRTVKAYDGEMREYKSYADTLEGVDDVYKVTSIAHGVKDGLISFFGNAMTATVLFLVSFIIIKEPNVPGPELEVGAAVKLMMSLMFSTMGLTQAAGFFQDFRKANISTAKLMQIIDLKPNIDRKAGPELTDVQGEIEFRDVGFKYPTRDQWAVKGLSFRINKGETVALVGESGCGKTTTLSLLQRFYEITEGQILVDGRDIREYSQISLRKHISVVPQTPVLFSMSILDNIKYSKIDATNAQVQEAASSGNAHNFIMTMSNNYKTEVQQSSLSGGQKQRICISRAILADTPILLLDEATAALDTESERLVQESLEKIRHGKTAIVVAHRLATVKNADRILVFKDGAIAESGTHDELINVKNGIYLDLIKFQLQ